MDNLIKWKMVVVNRCIMCKFSCETIEHLLLHCPIASELWSFVHSFEGKMDDAKAGDIVRSGVFGVHKNKVVRQLTPNFLMCYLLRMRSYLWGKL